MFRMRAQQPHHFGGCVALRSCKPRRDALAPRIALVSPRSRLGHLRTSPAHASDTRLQPDAIGGLDVFLRHLLGPYGLRPAPGRLLQLQPRSHGVDRNSTRRARWPPTTPPSPPERAPAPASRKNQALPSDRQVNHLRAPQPPRPPAPSSHDQPQSAPVDTRQSPRLRTLEAYALPQSAHACSQESLRRKPPVIRLAEESKATAQRRLATSFFRHGEGS